MIGKTGIVGVLLLAVTVLVGCGETVPGSSRILGPVDYNVAFAAATEVMSQHFSIAETDRVAGKIVSRPKVVQTSGGRILSGSPARQIATLHITEDSGVIVAFASVVQQRSGQGTIRGVSGYSSVPNETPAQLDAATTPQQNTTWDFECYAKGTEHQLLNDLFNRLHPEAAAKAQQPATTQPTE